MTYRSDFTILLFRPFSASLVPLELFSDCFGNVIFLFSLLKVTVPLEAKEGPDILKFLEAEMIVFNLHKNALARSNLTARAKKPFRASLRRASANENALIHVSVNVITIVYHVI